MPNTWMVRAGRGGYLAEDFEKQSCVAIGWKDMGDFSQASTMEELAELHDKAYPDLTKSQRSNLLGQVKRFVFELAAGDNIISYNGDTREYLVGEITGKHQYQPDRVADHPNTLDVTWAEKVSRDDLSVQSRNRLGGIGTLFQVNDAVWEEIQLVLKGESHSVIEEAEEEALEDIRQDVVDRAHEFIKDMIKALKWDQMQELVAGILEAMGYKTLVSKPGPDRGKDIMASPDGLGLESPRIRVEVKHRNNTMGAPDIRSFIGALRQNDKGLYVSTGGFTKEAHYEAERSTVPITLIDLDGIVELITEHYENLDAETRTLVPLKRFYWPLS